MKKIANFTQTYQGDPIWSPGCDNKDREFLIDALRLNPGKYDAINLLDYQTFNFHNLTEEKSKQLAKKIKKVIPNCQFYVYQNMTFGSTILKHLQMLRSNNITDFLWVQDDEFFIHTNFEDFKNLLNYYRENKDLMHINLLYSFHNNTLTSRYATLKNVDPCEEISITSNLKLYNTHTDHLKNASNYRMDFSAFLCNIDYFLKYMFSAAFINIFDAYKLESAINEFSTKNNIQRYFTNINFFESFNIVGMPPSLNKSDEALTRLKNICSQNS